MRFNKHTVDFTLRIHDATIQQLINEIAQEYGNRTAAVNACLAAGAPIVYEETFRKKANVEAQQKRTQESQGVEALLAMSKQIKELRLTQDDLYVMINNLEFMLASLYNIKVSEIEDQPVSIEMIKQGLLAELPEELRPIKQELQQRYQRKKT